MRGVRGTSLETLHDWVKQFKPKPSKCANCNKPPRDLANISGEYKKDIEDYVWLCRLCHMKSDGRLDKLIIRGRTANTGRVWSEETKIKISITKRGACNENVASRPKDNV